MALRLFLLFGLFFVIVDLNRGEVTEDSTTTKTTTKTTTTTKTPETGTIPPELSRVDEIILPIASNHITDYGRTLDLKMKSAMIRSHREIEIDQFFFKAAPEEVEQHFFYAIDKLDYFDTTKGNYKEEKFPSLRLVTDFRCEGVGNFTNGTLKVELPEKMGWDTYKYIVLGTKFMSGRPGFAAGYVELGEKRFGPCYLEHYDASSCPNNCVGTCPTTTDTICEEALKQYRAELEAEEGNLQNKRVGENPPGSGGSNGLSPQSPLVALLFFLTAGIWICYAGIQSWISKDSFSTC